MKQLELAERLNVSKSYVSEIENGNRTPSLDVIQRYADTFRIPMSSIMFFSENLDEARKGNNISERARTAIASKIVNLLKIVEARTELDGVR